MEKTVNQENATNETQVTNDDKTFTQAELDAIVADRLKRERSKYEGFDDFKNKAAMYDEMVEANKSELQKATERAQALETELNDMKKKDSIRTIREKVASETGVPASLLLGEDEESCTSQAKQIMEFAAKNGGYPILNDGGEVTNNTNKPSTRQQFADWWGKTTN